MWKWILQLPPLSVTECFTGRAFQNLDPTPETLITYPPQHQKSRTDPGNHNTSLAAVRVLAIKGWLILQVTLMSSAKKWSTHKSLQRWVTLYETSTGNWIVLLSSDRFSQEKKYYHLVIIILIGIKIIPLWWLTIINDETKLKNQIKTSSR